MWVIQANDIPPLSPRGLTFFWSHSSDSQTAGKASALSAEPWRIAGHTSSVALGLKRALHRPGEVDPEHPTIEFVEVHVVDGILGIGRRGVRHEGEPTMF